MSARSRRDGHSTARRKLDDETVVFQDNMTSSLMVECASTEDRAETACAVAVIAMDVTVGVWSKIDGHRREHAPRKVPFQARKVFLQFTGRIVIVLVEFGSVQRKNGCKNIVSINSTSFRQVNADHSGSAQCGAPTDASKALR